MDRITRYLILLFFFLVFLGLAPVIVLYVSGTNFGISQGSRDSTGILDVQSEPGDATVFINGEKSDSTPATIRFLEQGMYDIRVSKDGYYDWSKRLFVEGNQVTYSGGHNDIVKLLPQSQVDTVTQDEVTAAVFSKDLLVYSTTKNELKTVDLEQPESQTMLTTLSKPVTKIWSANKVGLVFVRYQDGTQDLFDVDTSLFVPLPEKFKTAKHIMINNDDISFALIENQLWQAPLGSTRSNLVINNVLALNMIENNIYIARQNPDPLLSAFAWNGSFLDQEQVLVSAKNEQLEDRQWPDTEELSLLVTARREVFAQTSNKLYRVNQTIEEIASQVKWVDFNSVRGELVYKTPAGVWFYNFITSKTVLLYRSSADILTAQIRPELGYGFIGSTDGVRAIETDTRTSQNTYDLLENQSISQVLITNDDQYLIAYNPETLTVYKIQIKR